MFEKCTNQEECKKLFRRLSKHLHPDMGGEDDLFIMLQDSYEFHQKSFEIKKNPFNNKIKTNYSSVKYSRSYENVNLGDERLNIIEEISSYSENHQKFDTKFIDSIVEFLESSKFITAGQYNSLVKIYYNFRMDKPV